MAELFKVNRLYLLRNPPVLLSNFNIPLRLLNSSQTFERVLAIVCVDYDESLRKVYFAISATYVLEHKQTGEEKFFAGSFHARGIQQSLVAPFQPLVKDTFVNSVLIIVNVDRVINKLKLLLPNSVWQVKELTSIIINVQGETHQDHKAIQDVFD